MSDFMVVVSIYMKSAFSELHVLSGYSNYERVNHKDHET